MPMLPTLALLIGLAGPTAEVTAPTLDVFDAPGGAATRTGRLRRGSKVVVRGERGEWLEIAPPPGSFSWVDEDAIREDADGGGRVIAAQAEVRTGRPGARLPGPPGVVLNRGQAVRLLPRKPLTLGEGKGSRTYRAIEPPADELRFVRVEGVDLGYASTPIDPRMRRIAQETVEPGIDSQIPPPPEVAAELGRIESDHRRALRGSLETWRLEPVCAAYRQLLAAQASPAARDAVQARLDQAERQARLAKDARTLRSLLEQSRRLDPVLKGTRALLHGPARSTARDFDARGLLQPSSKQVEGQHLFALIGPDGVTVAYIDVPPGLDADRLVGHQVGVRGKPRPRLDLSARLLEVQDLEDLQD